MADLAIGISKTAIEALVNKVQSAIKEEEEQWQIVQHDLVFITDEFEMMQSFLNSADRKLVKNTVVRTWVRQVRDLSYDAEDCIEFVLHLDTKKSSVWFRMLPFFCKCCKVGVDLPLDQVVTEIKQLKRRVEDVSQRNIRYRLISDSGSESRTQQRFASGSGSGKPGFDILAEARETTAMAGGLDDLTKLIKEESDALQVISVWGTGDDLGTVSIIRNMYEDSRRLKEFKHRAWVKVMDPVNPHEFIRSMVVQFYTNPWQQEHGATAVAIDALSWTESSTGRLLEEFVQQVDKDRYLIILEGLSSMVQWDNIKPYLPDKKNGSRIVVSTRHHEIARMCTGKPHRVLELQQSSSDHSICIFFNQVISSITFGQNPTFSQFNLHMN